MVFADGAGKTTRHGFSRLFADHFARQGIAVLVYDKRGAGESTGTYGGIVRDYGALATDLLAAVRLLAARADIDAGRIGVRATSEGGWVAPLAAARSGEIAFLMAISPPATQATSGLWEMQNKLRDAEVADDALHTLSLASTQVLSVVRLLGLGPPCCRDASFPVADWEKVHQPVLLIYGQLDKQVPPALSARMITDALERGGNRAYTLQAFSDANHAIMMAKSGFESELASAAAVRFAPGYLDAMTSWLRARLAGEASAADHGWRPKVAERVADVERPPWHARPLVQLSLWGIFLAVFFATSTSRLLPRLLRRPRMGADPDPAVRRTQRLAVGVSAVNLSVAAGIVVALGQFVTGQPLPSLWTALRLLALTSAFLAVALVVAMRRSWRSSWRARGRSRHAAVTVAGVAFVPFLAYWRLLPSLVG